MGASLTVFTDPLGRRSAVHDRDKTSRVRDVGLNYLASCMPHWECCASSETTNAFEIMTPPISAEAPVGFLDRHDARSTPAPSQKYQTVILPLVQARPSSRLNDPLAAPHIFNSLRPRSPGAVVTSLRSGGVTVVSDLGSIAKLAQPPTEPRLARPQHDLILRSAASTTTTAVRLVVRRTGRFKSRIALILE